MVWMLRAVPYVAAVGRNGLLGVLLASTATEQWQMRVVLWVSVASLRCCCRYKWSDEGVEGKNGH